MVIDTSEISTLNAQASFPKVLIGSGSFSKGASIFSTTYIVESTGNVFVKAFEYGTDVASGDGSIKISAVSSFNSSFAPSTTVSTTSFLGGAGIVFAPFNTQYPIDTVLTITVSASVSTTSTVGYAFELSELQTGIFR
jgi:hypothetical protein